MNILRIVHIKTNHLWGVMWMHVKSRSLLGHLKEYRKSPLAFLESQLALGEDVVPFRFGNRRIVLLCDPSLIKQVLVSKQDSFGKSKPFKELDPLLGKGLLLSEGDLHKQQRKLIQPSFTPRHIEGYAEDMGRITNSYVSKIQKDGIRNISTDMLELTLAIISKTMFSTSIRKEDVETIGEHLDSSMRIATKRIRSIVKTPRNWKTKENVEAQNSVNAIDRLVNAIIKERLKTTNEHYDMLSVLMNAKDSEGNKMDEQLLRDEVMTVFLAGHETTANALIWTLYEVSKNNNIANDMREEVDHECRGTVPSYEEVKNLRYTKNVMLESMRMYPPAWLFGREALKDVTIGDLKLKKGQTVMISPYVMHRNPSFIENPKAFLPDRFENGRLKNAPDYVYIPFGGGDRVCIGQHFALMEATIILGAFMKNFDFSLPDNGEDIEPEPLITLRPDKNVRLHLKVRNQKVTLCNLSLHLYISHSSEIISVI